MRKQVKKSEKYLLFYATLSPLCVHVMANSFTTNITFLFSIYLPNSFTSFFLSDGGYSSRQERENGREGGREIVTSVCGKRDFTLWCLGFGNMESE